ncbi:unnamed protein product [Ilex paraguariensis]|uniref:Glutamate receptor n=1 Tax=Ilex paraguariensis TaxID=185542 RepID=A0ABC8S1J0_9AQUA
MTFPLTSVCTLIYFLLIFSNYGTFTSAQTKTTSIGAIIDDDTRIGKEVKAAMKVAAQNFNSSSLYHKLSLHFRNTGGNPLQAAYAAEELLKENNVEAIIGMETWEKAVLVADVGNRAQVPIISFASASIKQPIMPPHLPFLVQMATNVTEQIICITEIIRSFNWRKVIVIYEANYYGTDFGMFVALSNSLKDHGVEIEYRLILPSFSSLSDPKGFVSENVAELLSKQSMVFIVLQISSSMAAHLFRQAKQMRLIGRDSAWIIADPFASLLDSVNTSVISSMEGALGIKTYFVEDSRSFLDFRQQFRRVFQSDYPEEENSEMGIHALRAYDSITTIANAINRTGSSGNGFTTLLKSILSSNYIGLSGDISFHGGELVGSSLFTIVNVIGKRYKELGFWSSSIGFSESLVNGEIDQKMRGDSMDALAGLVSWSGDLKVDPRGWPMHSNATPLKIGVPRNTTFPEFVKVDWNSNLNKWSVSGFCIDVFYEVLNILEPSYPLPHVFVPYTGTYNDLVDHVANKTFDAVIGDVTILANRSKYVQFTAPYAESSLSMIVTVKPKHGKAWIFLMPFTMEMWAVTAALLLYTVFIIWLLERQSNPEFAGPWHNQLATSLWFTSTSLFFAHRERVQNSYTRVVVVVWLFVVLVLSSSYTASFSSMLTVQRLKPNITDIEWLQKNNAPVGCDNDSFIKQYLQNVLQFNPQNIKGISRENEYVTEFENGNIIAAFLELPESKAFMNQFCKGYTVVTPTNGITHRFGGFGFVSSHWNSLYYFE